MWSKSCQFPSLEHFLPREKQPAATTQTLFSHQEEGRGQEEEEKFLLADFPTRDLERFITPHNWFSSVNILALKIVSKREKYVFFR